MIGVVVARASNGVIGRGNELPWRQREDLRRFSVITSNSTVIMGRRTYESIIARNGEPLPRRRSVVVTRNPALGVHDGVVVVSSLEEAMALIGHTWGYVIGGVSLYAEALAHPQVERVHMTRILGNPSGDVVLNDLDSSAWSCKYSSETFPSNGSNQFPFRFEEYRRVG